MGRLDGFEKANPSYICKLIHFKRQCIFKEIGQKNVKDEFINLIHSTVLQLNNVVIQKTIKVHS